MLISDTLSMSVAIYGENRKRYHVRKKAVRIAENLACSLLGVHELVANARADFQHKLSHSVVDENQAVIVGTLKSVNMMRNHNMACAIGDAGWNGFITKLEYKAAETGVHVVKLDQSFASSKSCHYCGHKMPLNKRIWQCSECGIKNYRDTNATINIRHRGILDYVRRDSSCNLPMEASVNTSHRRLLLGKPRLTKWGAVTKAYHIQISFWHYPKSFRHTGRVFNFITCDTFFSSIYAEDNQCE